MATAVSPIRPASFLEECSIHSKFDILLEKVPGHHFFPAANMRKLLEKYSNEELSLIYHDLIAIHEQIFSHATKALDYLVTAGGPAEGKSTLLENIVDGKGEIPEEPQSNIQRVYIDPDRTCLLQMEQTYKKDISTGNRDPEKAYEHWREASNFLANYYLAIALKEGYAIAHGSTMATPHAKNALTAIRDLYGYKTTIIHLTCEEEVRIQSAKKRQEEGVVQCTEIDFHEKQAKFFTLLGDYINSANKVLFCYRHAMDATTWAAKIEDQQLFIFDEPSLLAIQKLHDAAVEEGFWAKTTADLKK